MTSQEFLRRVEALDVKTSRPNQKLITTGSPDLTDIATALAEIVNDANRASAIIAQIRELQRGRLVLGEDIRTQLCRGSTYGHPDGIPIWDQLVIECC